MYVLSKMLLGARFAIEVLGGRLNVVGEVFYGANPSIKYVKVGVSCKLIFLLGILHIIFQIIHKSLVCLYMGQCQTSDEPKIEYKMESMAEFDKTLESKTIVELDNKTFRPKPTIEVLDKLDLRRKFLLDRCYYSKKLPHNP